MKAIYQHQIIQIDITNKCFNTCTNCTRFCGHHKQPFYMGLHDFRNALVTLQDFAGVVGIMGGEPTLHPDFKMIMRTLRELRPETEGTIYVQRNATDNFDEQLRHSRIGKKCGLFTTNLNYYYNNYEEIQRTFGYQLITDHKLGGTHVPLLIPRKELGIPDDEWIKLRDNCWVQNYWSSAITPKGAFFCEVAAAMDMLFDGPGGWPLTMDWWYRYPNDYNDQLHWCEMCSACLAVPHQEVSNTSPDLVSPKMYEKLKEIGSPKLQQGNVSVIDIDVYDKTKYDPCGPSAVRSDQMALAVGVQGKLLAAQLTAQLSKKHIIALTICKNYSDYLSITIPYNKDKVDRFIVITDEEDVVTQDLCKQLDVEIFISKQLHRDGAVLAKGAAYNECISYLKKTSNVDWLLFTDADIILPVDFRKNIASYILNKDCLHYCKRWWPEDNRFFHLALQDHTSGACSSNIERAYTVQDQIQWSGYFQLVNIKSCCLQGLDAVYPAASDNAQNDDANLSLHVFRNHTILLPEKFNVLHIPHSNSWTSKGVNWLGRVTPPLQEIVPSLFI